MRMKLPIIWLMLAAMSQGHAQDAFTFSRGFTKKLQRAEIEFYMPADQWLKLTQRKKDEFLKYDAVLESPGAYEMRVIMKAESRSRPIHPHVEMIAMINSISTNEEDANIRIAQFPQEHVKYQYGADWGIYSDFIPKMSFSTYAKGRVLCLYKEGMALATCIILYDEKLDPYHLMPLRFL